MSKSRMCYLTYQVFLIAVLAINLNLGATEENQLKKIEAPKTEVLKTIYFGVTPASNASLDLQDTEIGLSKSMSEILKSKHFKVEIKVYDSKEALFKDLDSEKLYGFWGGGLEVLERIDTLMEPMIARKCKDTPIKQPYLILAKKQDGIKSILQLKSKKLVLPVLSGIQALYLNTKLLKNNQPEIQQFFLNLPAVKNANLAIMDVYFGHADVTMVKLQDYKTAIRLNPQLSSQIMVVEQTPAYIISAAAASKKNDELEALSLIDSIIDNSKNPATKGFLSLINADGLEYVGYDEFNSLAILFNEYRKLKRSALKSGTK